MNKKEEIKLVKQLQSGEEEAFNALYEQYHRVVLYIALKTCNNQADAQDILQDTFIQIKKSVHLLRDPAYFRLWMYKITMSKCKNLFKRNKDLFVDFNESEYQNNILATRREEQPLKELHFQSDKEMLDYFIDALPQPQRVAIVMMYYQQLTMEEISDVLNVPLGTIKSRIFLAKKQLKTMISKYQSKNGTTLDFQSKALEAALASYFAKEIGAVIVGSNALESTTLLKKGIQVIQSHTIMGLAVIASGVIVTGGITAFYLHKLQNQNDALIGNVNHQEIADEAKFPIVILDQKTYDDAADAYYGLREWAHCSYELKEMTKEEKRKIEPLYNALKSFGGPYYEMLTDLNWSEFYQNIK